MRNAMTSRRVRDEYIATRLLTECVVTLFNVAYYITTDEITYVRVIVNDVTGCLYFPVHCITLYFSPRYNVTTDLINSMFERSFGLNISDGLCLVRSKRRVLYPSGSVIPSSAGPANQRAGNR